MLLNTVLSLAVGALISLLVSRYYFLRGQKHRLAVYIHSTSRIFAGADEEVRRALTVHFRGKVVEDLGDYVYLVANEGAHAIRAPLTVKIPKDARLVDAAVPYVHPPGRLVRVAETRGAAGHAICEFDLLNPGEYFLLKLLVDGPASPREVEFLISAEGLPPRVEPTFGDYSTSDDRRRFPIGEVLAGVVLLLTALATFYVLAQLKFARPDLLPLPPGGFRFTPLAVVASAAAALLAITGCLIAALSVLILVLGFSPRSTFSVPQRWRRGGSVHLRREEFVRAMEQDRHRLIASRPKRDE